MFLLGGGQPASSKLYVDDVFSAYTYQGNGASQTITNGIDLAGKGGMVWAKSRVSAQTHFLIDSNNNLGWMSSATTSAVTPTSAAPPGVISSFNSNGYTLGINSGVNLSGEANVSWTFRKSPKFFDVVTYTGNDVTGRQIAHNLGVAPGMIIVKCTSSTTSWNVYHQSSSLNFTLNTADPGGPSLKYFFGDSVNVIPPTASVFTVGRSGIGNEMNGAGQTYVAYLFAHDASTDGIIQCGSFTTDGSGNATVNLGWEPQFVMWKRTDGTGDWKTVDSMRGFTVSGVADAILYPNLSSAEVSSNIAAPTATGFTIQGEWAPSTHIYLAIRRPNKPPTSGTQVFQSFATVTDSRDRTYAGFPVDTVLAKRRDTSLGWMFSDRLRGPTNILNSNSTSAESTSLSSLSTTAPYSMIGYKPGSDGGYLYNSSNWQNVEYSLRRAPGVFDIVCEKGTGSVTTFAHNLGVVPELMIVKSRGNPSSWQVYSAAIGAANGLGLDLTNASFAATGYWNSTAPTSSVFTLGSAGANISGVAFVAYLFATKAGISKVGSYTGNGGSQTINCGFATGVRFVLIKRTDSTGDWYVWDSTRGIVAANDPYLKLNATSAEASDDSIDPDSSGFIVNGGTSANVNVSGATYIFLAIA